jgi:hypothetical protein
VRPANVVRNRFPSWVSNLSSKTTLVGRYPPFLTFSKSKWVLRTNAVSNHITKVTGRYVGRVCAVNITEPHVYRNPTWFTADGAKYLRRGVSKMGALPHLVKRQIFGEDGSFMSSAPFKSSERRFIVTHATETIPQSSVSITLLTTKQAVGTTELD